MFLRIKWLAGVLIMTGILGHLAYAAEVSPSPQPSPHGGEEEISSQEAEKVAEDAIKIPDVVAIVNGEKITKGQLEGRMAQVRAMNPEGFDALGLEQRKMEMLRTLDGMILREALYKEAVRKDISVSDEEINENLEAVKGQLPSEDAFGKALSDAGLTISSWKEEMRKNLMAVKLEEQTVAQLEISDKEIGEYYEKNKKDLNKDAIKISHILVETEEEARKVIGELEKEKDFGGLAKRYSIDTFSKDKGGDIGWYGEGDLLKEVEDAAHPLSPGQISGPVKSQYGYHIIRLDEKKGAAGQTLEDHREHVRSILRQEKWRKLKNEWVKAVLNRTEVWKWSP